MRKATSDPEIDAVVIDFRHVDREPRDGRAYASQFQGLRITIANLGHMGSFVSRTNSNFCRTVLRLSDSVVTNTAAFVFTHDHMNILYFP